MRNILIADLMNSMMPLSQGLIRASYIFKELNANNLLEWCNKEMNGYEDRENVPDYRKFQGILTTEVINGFSILQNVTIPMNKNDNNLTQISTIHDGNSISAIETLLKTDSDTFTTPVPSNNYWVAQKYIKGTIQNLRVITHKAAFEQIITSVQKELIDKLKKLGLNMNYLEETSTTKEEFLDKKFVLTGSLNKITRDEASKIIEDLGGSTSGSVSTKTNIVIVGDNPGSKYTKALELGITVWSEEEFLEKIKE